MASEAVGAALVRVVEYGLSVDNYWMIDRTFSQPLILFEVDCACWKLPPGPRPASYRRRRETSLSSLQFLCSTEQQIEMQPDRLTIGAMRRS